MLLSFPKGDRDHILTVKKRTISSQKWLQKILLKKPFLLSAHKLSYFLSGIRELGAWLNCTTFIISVFWWSVAIESKRKLDQAREKATPHQGPWYDKCRADVLYQTQQHNSWGFWPDILPNREAEAVLEHWYLDELLWSILTWLCRRQKKCISKIPSICISFIPKVLAPWL